MVANPVTCHHIIHLCFEYAIGKVREDQKGLELNGTPQLVVSDYFHLVDKCHNKITCCIVCNKEVGREVNADKSVRLIV